MDYSYLYHGIAKAKKPLFVISARISPRPDSALFDQYERLCFTFSTKVRDTIVKRLFEQGYTKDDIKVNLLNVASL